MLQRASRRWSQGDFNTRMIRKILNTTISKLKGTNYTLDERIPTGYLLSLLWTRLTMAFRGLLVPCRKKGVLFVGPRVKIKAASLIKLGKGVTIDRNSYIDALSVEGILLGDNVSIGKSTTIECSGSIQDLGKGLKVGNNVGLGTHGFYGCAGGIEINDDTIIGNYVSFHSENHNYGNAALPIRLQGVNRKGIRVGKNCWIGAKVTILDGAEIGDNTIIAAGAVVTEGTYTGNVILGGVPAKIIKKI